MDNHKVLLEAWERLKKEATKDMADSSGKDFLTYFGLMESLNGDAGFMVQQSRDLFEKDVYGIELEVLDRFLLAMILGRITTNHSVALALSGNKGRGAPKKVSRQLNVAMNVVDAIFDGGATSVEDAWEMVAKSHGLDIDTVRKYWGSWKNVVAEIFKEALVKDGAEDFDAALKVMIRNNKGI